MKQFPATRKLPRALSAVCFALLVLGFLFISVDFVLYSPGFYRNQFAKNNAAEEVELSQAELDRVMYRLIDYFKGKTDDLQIEVTFESMDEPRLFYTEDELSHMADVKKVFAGFKTAAVVLLVASLLGLALLVLFTEKREVPALLSRGAAFGCGILFGILLLVGLALLLFFEPLFKAFHAVFFPQGNWQFPWDSNMLAILPESLFLTAAVLIAVSGLSLGVLLFAAGLTVQLVLRKKKKTAAVSDD